MGLRRGLPVGYSGRISGPIKWRCKWSWGGCSVTVQPQSFPCHKIETASVQPQKKPSYINVRLHHSNQPQLQPQFAKTAVRLHSTHR